MSDMRLSNEGVRLVLPLFVILPRKRTVDKRFWLNLNNYRNAHYHILSDAKLAFKEQVMGAMADAGLRVGTLLAPPVKMTYTYYPGRNNGADLANVLPIVQKFTDDALIELGVLKDDSCSIIPAADYRYGGIDRPNPRAEVFIQTIL